MLNPMSSCDRSDPTLEIDPGWRPRATGRRTPHLVRCFVAAALLALGLACAGGPADTQEPVADEVAEAAGAGATDAAGTDAAATDPAPLLDGTVKSMVVVGYSTSYAWPDMLQEMLDEHSGGERVYHVLNAVIGGSPVGRWIASPDSEDYQDTYGAMLRDFFGPDARLREGAPGPTVAIVQQSLQRTPTPETRLGPVTSVDDAEGIRTGADALETLARQLQDDGVERVYLAMHIYKEGYEPEVGNERFALEALLERGHDFIFRGPDVWSPTIREHPEAFTDDRLHPNERGMKIMAELWYRALAGDASRPEIVDAMHARDYDVDAMMDRYLAWREGGEGG